MALTPKKIRVLIIDDSASVRQALTKVLEEDPEIEVMGAASDPFMAARKIQEDVPDVITLDVEMPRMNGFELTTKIRGDSTLDELPVVLVTALESREDRERGIEVGANAYIVKRDFEQSNLLEVMRRLI